MTTDADPCRRAIFSIERINARRRHCRQRRIWHLPSTRDVDKSVGALRRDISARPVSAAFESMDRALPPSAREVFAVVGGWRQRDLKFRLDLNERRTDHKPPEEKKLRLRSRIRPDGQSVFFEYL